jgi:nucleotide-binding universal stress UspA family protein
LLPVCYRLVTTPVTVIPYTEIKLSLSAAKSMEAGSMTQSLSLTKPSLTLTAPVLKPILARRLSPAVAFRYRAVPVAEEAGRITVAMADPNDPTALAAVRSELGSQSYAVHCEAPLIDAMLAAIWPPPVYRAMRVMVWGQPGPVTAEVQAYAQRLSNLLDGHLVYLPAEAHTGTAIETLTEAADVGYNLIALGQHEQSLLDRLLGGPLTQRVVDKVPTSLLVAHQPRWPLRKILLVARGTGSDEAMLNWVVRLAQPTGSLVTILALTPYLPSTRTETDFSTVLATNTEPGRQLQRLARGLTDGQVKSIVRLRQGQPETQLRQELAEESYDLIVLAAEPEDGLLRRMLGEFVGPLLRWVDRPVLIVKTKAVGGGGRTESQP